MRLSRVNTVLLVLIIAINGYIICMPVLPKLTFWWQKNHTHSTQKLEAAASSPIKSATTPTDNRLIIPSMLLDEPINDGPNATTLRKGLWRRPATSTPDRSANTVIVGHRFTYTNPRGTLYNLDKVRVGDEAAVFWHGQRYRYRVKTVQQVKADDTAVEAPTTRPTLTIYTCTPLWLPKDRLVVTATLEDS